MPNIFDPYKDDTKVQGWEPPWGYDPPTPPIYSYPSGRGGGRSALEDWSKFGRRKWKRSDQDDGTQDNQVGYETDWKYPNWLIRMAQWRNF